MVEPMPKESVGVCVGVRVFVGVGVSLGLSVIVIVGLGVCVSVIVGEGDFVSFCDPSEIAVGVPSVPLQLLTPHTNPTIPKTPITSHGSQSGRCILSNPVGV